MPPVDHIRVGFVDAESRCWPVDTQWGKGATQLAAYLWRASVNDRLDLVLGITPNGASYLLLPRAWVSSWNHRVAGEPGFSARRPNLVDYYSLAPIHFIGRDSLEKRLKDYEQGKKKPGIRDTSRANKQFCINGNNGVLRAEFENSRLFCLLSRSENSLWLPPPFRQAGSDITTLSRETYAVPPYSARSHARVLALSFSTITAGTVADTRILDVGWCDVFVQTSVVANARNYKLYEQSMKVPGQRFTHDSVTSETQPSDVIKNELEQILRLARPEKPLILLVHSVEDTCSVLEELGIRTSSWKTGIYDVLYNEGLRSRERSRSPGHHSSGRRSLPQPRAAVHLVDVDLLIKSARGSSLGASPNINRVEHILKNAAKFNLDIEGREVEVEVRVPRGEHQPPETPEIVKKVEKIMYNAGHDSALIAETWLSLVDGPDIDELGAQLRADDRNHPEASNSPTPPPVAPDTQREPDDDYDPNMELPATTTSRAAPPQPGILDPYDLSDEEGEYY